MRDFFFLLLFPSYSSFLELKMDARGGNSFVEVVLVVEGKRLAADSRRRLSG
jgi:hypothetical protein